MHFQELPPRVIQATTALATRAAADGLRVFVFGSFARGDARPTSDLDLGFEPVDSAPPARPSAESVRQLRAAVAALPTIRPVDLVDFTEAPLEFRNLARRVVLPLSPSSSPPPSEPWKPR